jgi:hypothetical protein
MRLNLRLRITGSLVVPGRKQTDCAGTRRDIFAVTTYRPTGGEAGYWSLRAVRANASLSAAIRAARTSAGPMNAWLLV